MPPPPPLTTTTYRTIYTHLLTLPPPLLPPGHLHSTTLRASIASLSVHPVLETALHILNADLPSAHFLVRHMQSAPAWEAMYLHGILHRVEGDYDNARAWYTNVKDSDVFKSVWSDSDSDDDQADSDDIDGNENDGFALIAEVERLRIQGKGEGARVGIDVADLGRRSRGEIERVVRFCEGKFGTGRVEDARDVWVRMGDEHKAMAEGMIVGGEGWREF